MKYIAALGLFTISSFSCGQSILSNLNNGVDGASQIQMTDLKQTQVDLGFDFPFYEEVYDDVWVTYTGVLNFQDTTNGSSFCCQGKDITSQYTHADTRYDYSIFALWTDLDIEYVANPWFKATSDKAIFGWYNVPEWYRRLNDVSSFELELHDTGEIKFKYDQIDIVNHTLSIGLTGDMSEGQYYQFEYKVKDALGGGWTQTSPFQMSFNTQTGVAVDRDGNVTNHTAWPVDSIDPCIANPSSCAKLNLDVSTAIANLNTGPEIFGDDITDFIDDPSLNFGPDPFETYEQTLLPTGPGSGQDGFFDSSFDGFDTGSVISSFSDDGQFGGPPSPEFDGLPPPETFDGQPPQDFFGGPPSDGFSSPSFDDISFETTGALIAEIETFEDTSMPSPPGAPPPPPGSPPPPPGSAPPPPGAPPPSGEPPPPEGSFEEIVAETSVDDFEEDFEEPFEETFEEEFVEEVFEEIAPLPEEIVEVAEVIAEPVAPGKPAVTAAAPRRAARPATRREVAGPRSSRSSNRVNAARRVDAVSIARSQIQASEQLAQGAATAGAAAGGSRDIVPSQSQGPNYGAPITEQSIVENIINQNSGSSDGSMGFSSGNMDVASTFGTFGTDPQGTFNDSVTIDFSFGRNDPIFVNNFTDSSSSQQTDLQGFTDVSSQSSTGLDQNFGGQADQALSAGGSITEAITAELPDFSRFDVSPLPEEEQETVDKAERQMENMSDSAIESNLDTFVADMQTTGGFDSNQGLTLVLMNRVNGFNQYGNMLQDRNFYATQSMLNGGNLQNDRNAMLQLIGTSGKHRQMVEEQYR